MNGRNYATDRDSRGTIIAGSSGQRYIDNVFYNPDNDYEMIALNWTGYFENLFIRIIPFRTFLHDLFFVSLLFIIHLPFTILELIQQRYLEGEEIFYLPLRSLNVFPIYVCLIVTRKLVGFKYFF